MSALRPGSTSLMLSQVATQDAQVEGNMRGDRSQTHWRPEATRYVYIANQRPGDALRRGHRRGLPRESKAHFRALLTKGAIRHRSLRLRYSQSICGTTPRAAIAGIRDLGNLVEQFVRRGSRLCHRVPTSCWS